MDSIKAAALVLIAMTGLASPLSASWITYDIINLVTTDGAVATGTINYDTIAGTVTSASVYITDPVVGIASPIHLFFDYYQLDYPGTYQLAFTEAGHENSCPSCLVFNTSTPLGAPTVTIAPNYMFISGPSGLDFSLAPAASLSTASTTPEPATTSLMLLGALCLIGGNRFRKYRQVKQQEPTTLQSH